MDTIVIYHNPRCSKSRAALALLQEHNVPLQVVEYLKHPLSRDALQVLRTQLGCSPHEWIRKGEAAYKEAGLGPDSTETELLDAMARHPVLIERPIAVRGGRAVVGRPPERVLDLLRGA